MRNTWLAVLAVAFVASVAAAELQNVEVGGSIRIRGNWYTGELWAWDSDIGNTWSFVEERTRLNVKADFTDQVSAFIELDSYDWWGEDFRSNWITGVDGRANTADDVEVYQSYIEANEMWGQPFRLRVGRQELAFGSQWLVGVNDTAAAFTGLSFDGIRLTYATDRFSVDAVWAKVAETSPLEEDGDVDFYALYGSYLGIEDVTLDAYWMWVRDARAITPDTANIGTFGWLLGAWEDWTGVDDWDPTNLYTVGLRGAGTMGSFDFEAEVAYQFGEADQIGRLFTYWYSDNNADFDHWGANVELGYTFDTAYTPRVYLGFVYLDGEDNRTPDSFSEWVYSWINPVSKPTASMGFNRLFSNWEYTEFFTNTDMSNVWIARAGVSAMPTEKLELLLALSYFEAVDDLAVPRWYLPPWRPDEIDGSLGWELGLYMTYNYSDDLTFEAGWAHLFVDDGLAKGNFVVNNGLGNYPGWRDWLGRVSDDDADYLFLQTTICF